MPRGVAHGRVVAAMLRIAFLQPFANARNSKEPGSTEMQKRELKEASRPRPPSKIVRAAIAEPARIVTPRLSRQACA
jgi:hypothetical protein